jgi:hypothetical protein
MNRDLLAYATGPLSIHNVKGGNEIKILWLETVLFGDASAFVT